MKNKKRFKSSDLNIPVFIISAGIGVLVGALFLCFSLLILSHFSFITKHLSHKHIKAIYILSFVLCGYISSFLFKRKSILISLLSSAIYCFLIYLSKIYFDFGMLTISSVIGALCYEVCKKDINKNKA